MRMFLLARPPATTEQISDFVQNLVVVLVDDVAEVKVVNGNHEFHKYKTIQSCPRDKIINKKKLKSRMS